MVRLSRSFRPFKRSVEVSVLRVGKCPSPVPIANGTPNAPSKIARPPASVMVLVELNEYDVEVPLKIGGADGGGLLSENVSSKKTMPLRMIRKSSIWKW